MLLHQRYDIDPDKAIETVNRLRIAIGDRATVRHEAGRRLTSGEIEVILAPGRIGKGEWHSAHDILQKDNPAGADPNKDQPLRWADFEDGRYGHRDEFDTAWEALKREGYVVVCGPAGTGKTSLCRYLAFKYLKENSQHRAYYISAKPGRPLIAENSFLENQVHGHTLFIIDDQHLAEEEVEKVAKTFLRSQTHAKLVVASTKTFSPTLALSRDEDTSVLNEAVSIRLISVNKDLMAGILNALRTRAGLRTPLSNEALNSLSKGYIGKAMILARCSQDFARHRSLQRLFKADLLGRTITDWILMRLGRTNDQRFFQDEVAPVFLIDSHGLSIPKDFTAAVEPLWRAGFLTTDDEPHTDASFYPLNLHLAYIIAQRYGRDESEALSSYLNKYPKRLAAICSRMANAKNEHSRSVFRQFCEENLDRIREIITDRVDPIGLEQISVVLRSIHLGVRGISNRLLQTIAKPFGQPDNRFFSNFIYFGQANSARAVKNFIETLYWIDRETTSELAQKQFDYPFSALMLSLFALDSCPLDDVAACLYAIRKSHPEFAQQLFEQYKRTPSFAEKTAQTDADPNGLLVWMKFCAKLRALNRRESLSFLQEHAPPSKIIDALLSNSRSNPMVLLYQLHKIYPRLSAEIASMLWDNYRDLLVQVVGDIQDLNALTNDLYALSQSHRRVAIRTGLAILDHICDLVRAQERYSKISSAVESLHKNVGLRVAQAAAQAIDKDRMLPLVQQEDRKIDVVGKFLYCIAEASPDVAAWFQGRLAYSDYLTRIYDLRLRNLTYLVRGLLKAAPPQHKRELYSEFLHDRNLIDEFSRGWGEVRNLTELSLCLSFLMESFEDRNDLLTLLNIENTAAFQEEIQSRIARDKSIFHIASGLYAAAKFDLEIGFALLERYVEKVESEAQKERANGNKQGRQNRDRRPSNPAGYKPNNLVDCSYLLEAAAAIDQAQACQLAHNIDLQRFAKYAINEINLGRLSQFIYGLHRTSRKMAREFVGLVCSEQVWQKQFEENEKLENVIHYSLALSHTSLAKGNSYVRFIIERYRDDINSALEVEANLMLVSNWLRVLAITGRDFANQNVGGISEILLSTASFDTRLRHFIEATEALLECGHFTLVKEFADKAVEEASQIKHVNKLQDWIVVLHKALRISREQQLNFTGFAGLIFRHFEDGYLAWLLDSEDGAILPACILRLLESTNVKGLEVLKGVLSQSQILGKARNERRIGHKALSLILAGASPEEIRSTAESITNLSNEKLGPYRAWESGLNALMFDTFYPTEKNPFLAPPHLSPAGLNDFLSKNLNEHVGNLEFGLALYPLREKAEFTSILERLQEALYERAEDELIGATRRLLQPDPLISSFNKSPHYVWVIIKNTVLQARYLTWEADLESQNDKETFKKN